MRLEKARVVEAATWEIVLEAMVVTVWIDLVGMK